jgi:hypothetical protein
MVPACVLAVCLPETGTLTISTLRNRRPAVCYVENGDPENAKMPPRWQRLGTIADTNIESRRDTRNRKPIDDLTKRQLTVLLDGKLHQLR